METTKLNKTIRVTSNKEQFKINVTMDFEGVGTNQLLAWSLQSQVIALQRVLRECSVESLNEMVENGYEVHALSAGTKPRTTVEVMNDAKNAISSLTSEQRNALIEELMA